MSKKRISSLAVLSLIAATLALGACSSQPGNAGAGSAVVQSDAAVKAQRNKQSAVTFYDQFFNKHDLTAADRFIGDSYTQHNPRVPNGKAAFVGAFQQIFAQNPQRQSRITQAIADGDLVALHVHTTTGPQDRGVAIVDIFRFDANGKIVEHWDVIQPVPESTASGNSMF